jgi:hypothetical protein
VEDRSGLAGFLDRYQGIKRALATQVLENNRDSRRRIDAGGTAL